MKKLFYIFIAALTLTSCDVISEGDRVIPVEVILGERRVLLEEFTGFRCVNCPTAAEIAHNLIDMYGEHVVVVGLHPDGTEWTRPATSDSYVDLRSEVATAYYQAFGTPQAFPIGMIDRTSFNGSVLQNTPTWMTCVNQQLVIDPLMNMTMTATSDVANRSVELVITATLEEEFSGAVNLQLLLLESGIVGYQVTPTGGNPNYVHNHVAREAINGTWGQKVSLPAVGETVDFTFTYEVPEEYVYENCSVVAFLYKDDNREVIQAYEVEL